MDRLRARPLLLALFGAAMLSSHAEEPPAYRDTRVRQAAATLLTGNAAEAAPRAEATLQGVDGLIALGSAEAVDLLARFVTRPQQDPWLRQRAVVGLGKIGSAEAVAALDRITVWAEQRRQAPPPFRFGLEGYPRQPEQTATGADGTRWALFSRQRGLFRERDQEWWVTTSTDGVAWTPPAFLGKLEMPGTLLAQLATGQTTLAAYTRDTDADGLADRLEAALGTDPAQADTDRDTVPDGADGNPLTPRPLTPRPRTPQDEEMPMRQAVFTVAFGLENTRDVLYLVTKDGTAPQEYTGFPGWVIPSTATHAGWANITQFTVKRISPTAAEVTLDHYYNPKGAHGETYTLMKTHNRWVVTRYTITWKS